jgi:hypothetical protein
MNLNKELLSNLSYALLFLDVIFLAMVKKFNKIHTDNSHRRLHKQIQLQTNRGYNNVRLPEDVTIEDLVAASC